MDRNIRWLGVGSAIRAAGLSLIQPFVALYLRNILGLGYVQIGVVVGALGVVPIIIYGVAGAIADRLGRRKLLLTALFAQGGGVLGVGVAMKFENLPGILGFALLVSAAGAVASPALSAYVADLATGSERTRGFTWWRIGVNLGFTVGVFSGGALIGFVGFPRVGIVAGVFILGGGLLLAWRLEPSPYDTGRVRRYLHFPGAAGSKRSWTESWRVIVSDRVFLAVCSTVSVASLSINQWATTFPLYANTVAHLPYAVVGVGLGVNGLLVVVAQAPTTRSAFGHRHTSLGFLGTLLYIAGFLLFGVAASFPALLLVGFLASVVILTMGENLVSIPYSTLPSNLAPPGDLGAYNGTYFAITGVGLTLATTFGGVVIALGLSPPVTWAILMLPAVPALAIGYPWIARRVPDSRNRA